ncbi:MAG: hypothetical protein NT012_00160 [Candidatus Nealsonbacteria bacterium]|nr:hypothetical protein [Candidatus Nealsonbacteria bacterium]MDP2967080.1 hypothetical protein [bacterium]
MPSKVFSAALTGLNAQIVEVEVDASYGLPSFFKLWTTSQQLSQV